MKTKRYLRQSATETWRLASYEPVPMKAPQPSAPISTERWDRRIWAALRRG